MNATVKKPESKSNTFENWLEKAFNAIPIGEVKEKLDAICEQCGCSLPSFYRWKRSGRVPNKAQRDKICEILQIDFNSKKKAV